MITSTVSLASILLCIIAVSSSTPSSHHGALPSHQKYYGSPINVQAADQNKNGEIACISPDTNIYEIYHKAEKEAKGVDMKCHFYLHNKEKSEYIGTLDINKALFDKLLTKYKHWLLTKLDSSNNVVQNQRDKVENRLIGVEGDDDISNNGVKDERVKVDSRLSGDAEAADRKNGHHNTHHHKPHHSKDSHHVKDIDDKRTKNKHYIELDPKYNETHKYFEVFLPKNKHKDDPRTIYINVDEENKEFSLFDNEKHREMNYKPIKIGLRELSAIADVIFSKAEAGKTVFTVNDENSQDSEKYEIKNVDYESVDEEEGGLDDNSVDLDSAANDADISDHEIDTIDDNYTELNETDVDEHENIDYDNTTDYLDLNNTETNVYDDAIQTETANNDTEPYIDDNIVESNITEPFSDYDELRTDNNEDLDNETLTQFEDNQHIDKATITVDNNNISNIEVHEISSEDAEQQGNILKEDNRRSEQEENGLRAQEYYAAVPDCNVRFDNICNNRQVPLNPTKMSNVKPHIDISQALPNALEVCKNVPSNSNFDSCMRPNVVSLPISNSKPCNNVNFDSSMRPNAVSLPISNSKPCNAIDSSEELLLPNNSPQFIPQQNLCTLPNEPCSTTLSNTIHMPIQSDRNIKNVPSNVLNYNSKLPPYVLNPQYQMPLKNNANFIDNSANICNSLPNLNKYRNYCPPFQNPVQQSSSCVSPKDLLTKLNKKTPPNLVSYPYSNRQISPLNYPSTKPNFPPNSLWYPQYKPCLPFSYKDQNPLPSSSNICSNLPLNNLCIPNKILEPAKKYSPYNIHLSPNDDMTIDPTKFGYITAMPFTKAITPTKSWVPAFKSSANMNKALDSSEHNRLDTTLPSFHSSFEDESRNFVHESSISNTNLDSSLTGPSLNLNPSTLLPNSNNLNNANVLSNETLEALIKLLTQSGYLVTGTGSKALDLATGLTENKLTSPATLDSTLIGSGLNFNQPPVELTSGLISPANLDSTLIGSKLNFNQPPIELPSGAGSSNVVSLPLDSTLLGENKLVSPSTLDSTLIGSKLNFKQPPVESTLGALGSPNVVSLPLDSALLGPGLDLLRPLDSTLIGPYIDLNKSPSNFIKGAVNPNVLPTTVNEINTLANLDLHRLNALDSSLVGPGLSLDTSAKASSLDSIPVSPNSGLNVLSSSFASSNVSPSDLNRNTESIALPTLDSTLLGSKLQLPKLTLDSSLIGPSLETLSSAPMFENRSPNMIVDDNNDTAYGNVPELLKGTLETKLGEDLVEKPVEKDVSNIINVDIPNSDETKVDSPGIDTDNDFNSNIIETTLESNVDSVEEFPVGDELNTINVNLTNNTESQIENPITIINNKAVNASTDMLQTELDLNTTVEGVESHANFDIVEPENETNKLGGTVVDSGLNEEIKTLNNVENVTGISNIEVNIDVPVLDSNSSEDNMKLELEEHPIDVSNTPKHEENPEDTIVLSTTNIKDGDLHTQTDGNDVTNNIEEINVTEKLLAANAPNEVININSDTEATNPATDEHLVQINNPELIYNVPDDTKKVLTQESRIAIPNDVATALDSTLIGPSLEMLKETPLNLIGGKVDSSLIGPSIFPKMVSTVHVPDIKGDNILDTSLIGASLFKGNTIEMKPRLNSETNLDSSLIGPSLNQDANNYLANDREGDRVNLPVDGGKANNLVEDRFADNSLVGHTLPVEEYTPTIVDNPLEYFDDANKLQNALLSILNSANTIDSSLTESDLLSVSKNAEDTLNTKESPEFVSSRFPPIDSFYNYNTGYDSSIKNAPSPTGIGSPFVCTVPPTPVFSSTSITPSLYPSSIPYSNVLSPSYPPPLYLNFLPHTRNEYPPLYLPAPKPFKTSIVSDQNIPNSSLPPSMYSYPVLTGNTLPSASESKSFAPIPAIPNSRPVSISTTAQNIPNSFLLKSLPPSLYLNPILTGNAFPSTSESKSFIPIPAIPNSRPVSIPITSPSSSSLVKPYQTLTLPSQPLLKDNSFTVFKPYSNYLLPSISVAPKLPEVFINSLPTKSSSTYLTNPFIVNSKVLSSVPNICPMLSNSISSLAPSSAISSPVSPLNLQTLTSSNLLNISPSLLQDQPIQFLPQSLSLLPSIQSITLPYSPNTPYLLKSTTDYQKPLYTSIINSLPRADCIKLPRELNTQLPLPISKAPICFNTLIDSPVNKWAIPSSVTPAQNIATPFSSTPIAMTPEFSKISTQIPEYKPYFQISSVPINTPLSEWKCFTPNEYIPKLLKSKVSFPYLKPESQIIDKEKESLLFNEIMSLLEQPKSEMSRDAHVTSTLPPNTATVSSTSILNSIPMPIEFKIQSTPPLTSMNQIKPLSTNSIKYIENLNMPSYFEPKGILDIKHRMPNLLMKETDNNFIIDKETINEIESLLERDKQSRSIPQFDANVISELKEPMYSVIQGDFEPCVSEDRTLISMASPVALARPILGVNNLNPPYTMYNLPTVDFKPYTTDDKAPIWMSSLAPYARPSIGVNNLKSPNPIYSLTPSKYEPYTVYDKTQTPIASPVSFARPKVNSFITPFAIQNTPLTSAPHSSEYSPYTPVIETRLASLTPSTESTPVPLSDMSSVTNEYLSLHKNLENLRPQSLILPNSQLTPLNLIKIENKPINENTLPKTDSFNWSEIDLKDFEHYVEETETNIAKTDVDKAMDENDLKDFGPYEEDTETSIAKTDVYNAEDNRLVYSNDLFDKNHEEPFISETQELNYIQEEKDLLPYASPNRDAFVKTISPSLRANLPQNTFKSLPIETVPSRLKYATPISTLPSQILKPLSLTPYKSTLDKVNPFKLSPICENVISPLSTPSSMKYTPSISMKPLQNIPISAYPTVPTSTFSPPNIASLPTGSFQSSLLTPMPKSFLKSSVPLTNSLPNNLQYLTSTKPCQPIPITVTPTPSSEFKPYFPVNKVSYPSASVTPSSAPNILDVTPLIPLSQVKEQPCLPFESKPYSPVNKVSNPLPSVSPCTVLSLPCDNTVASSYKSPFKTLSSSPMVYSTPKLTPLPCTTPVTIPGSITDYSTYTPSYPTKTLPIPPLTSNVTPLENKPSLPSFKSSFKSQMPLKPVYSSITPTLSSPVMQILDLPSNPYLPFSKSTPICENIPSLLPSVSSTPYTKPPITSYIPNVSPDFNKNLEMLSPKEYQPFATGYTVKNPVSGIKNPFISSSVSPIEKSPLLPLSNCLNSFKLKEHQPYATGYTVQNPLSGIKNPFITSSVSPIEMSPLLPLSNGLNSFTPYTSTVQIPSLISPHPSSYTPKLPCTTETPVPIKPILLPTKNYIAQNLPFVSNIPCLRPLLPKTESSISSPCINVMPSKPLSLGSGNIQPIEVPSSFFKLPPLSSYNLIKAPSIKPCLSPCIPINPLANAPINSPVSTIVPKPYMPTFEPTISPNSPCTSINIPAYLTSNTPINSLVSTIVPKLYTPILEPTVPPNYVPCTSVNIPTYSPTYTPINLSPTSNPVTISTITPKAFMPTFEPTVSSNQYLPTTIPAYSPNKPLTNTSRNISPSSYPLPISTTVSKPYTPIFEPFISPNHYPSPCISINLPEYSPTNILANIPTDTKPISPEPIPVSTSAPKLYTPRFEPTILPNHIPCTSMNIPAYSPTNPLVNTPNTSINISPTSYLLPISATVPRPYKPTFGPIIPPNHLPPPNQYLPPCIPINIPAYSPTNPLTNSPINISPTLPISTTAPKPSIPTFEPTVPPNQYVPTTIPVYTPSTPLATPINILPTSYPVPKPSKPTFGPIIPLSQPCIPINLPAYSPITPLANAPINVLPTSYPVPKLSTPIFEPIVAPNLYHSPCSSVNIPAYSPTKPLPNRPTNISPGFNPVPMSTTAPKPCTATFEPIVSPNYLPCTPFNIPAYSQNKTLVNRPINILPSSNLVPVSNTVPKSFEPTLPPKQYQPPCLPINLPAYTPTNPLANRPIINSPTSYAVPMSTTPYTPTFEPSIPPIQYQPPCIPINMPGYTPTLPVSATASKPYTPILEPITQIQTLPSIISPLNTKPTHTHPHILQSPIISSTPNICSETMKPSTVSTQSYSPFISLLSNLMSPLADKSFICSQPTQLPMENLPCKTTPPSPICIPSYKSPCMQEIVTPFPTIYQPLSPVSSGAKSPISSPSYYQLLSPILSRPKSPVTPICLPQSPFYTPLSDLPLNTAYNLPTPKPIQKPHFFLKAQNYKDLTQIPTPYITSYSQPCPQTNKVLNPTSPVEFLIPESRIKENKDFASLGDLNNLPNSLDGYIPYNVEEEKDIKPEDKEFDNENLYTKEESLFDTTTEVFDHKMNKELLEDNIHYINEDRPAYDTKYLIDNHYIQEVPINTLRNEDKIDTIDFTNRKMEYNNRIPKKENNTEFAQEPLYKTDELTPEITNKNPYIVNKNDYYTNQFNRPSTINLEPNPTLNLDNLLLQPSNNFDYKEMPNIKYSGYKSYQTPLTNPNNIPPLICNPCIPTYRSMDSKLGLDFNPTNIYTPTGNILTQPEFNFNTINLGPKSLDLTRPETNFNNFNLSPKSFDLRQNILNQPDICLNNVDLSPISNDLTTDTKLRQDGLNQPEICLNTVDLSPICNELTPDTKAIKDSLVKYIKENDITKQNNEITIPIGNIIILDTKPLIDNIEDFKDRGLDLKMWKSNVKIVNAEIKLKCKDVTFNNFMPILTKDSVVDYADVIKRYIEDKYGNCIVMDQPYSQENRHAVLNHFEPHAVGTEFNLLWPSQRW
ncbi:mucin-17-like [Spodoptera frugiperda]|uniref:Mucin-17-like n=1 Tax=Spodoptera frugiperda TaxID=7108 RepID=A0A9R0F181_SPOFR|nr:mucin-17-like [Spodoptera frugiperda]